MLNKYILSGTLAVACSGALLMAQTSTPGQQPRTQPQPTQSGTRTQTQTQAAAQASTVMTGCVYRERDIPGRAPNVAERVGVLEDYILADAMPRQQASAGTSSGTTAGAAGTSGTAGTSGSAASTRGSAAATNLSMFKLELVDDEKLQQLVGKRVEVTGRIDAESGDARGGAAAGATTSTTERVLGNDSIEIAEFEVAAIREISGTCPATPSRRQ